MSQSLSHIQTQEQQQRQQQHLSQVQLQTVRLLEMPIAQLEDHISLELDNNPSLEKDYDSTDAADTQDTPDLTPNTDEQERRDDALSDALDLIGQDDRMEGTSDVATASAGAPQYEDRTMTSFADTLLEQMNTEDLTPQQHQIMEYLIGSLDSDGLLRKDLATISDELAIYYSIFVEPDDIEDVLLRLQDFDPAGIAARSLQECLLIQVERMRATPLTMLMYRVIDECYDDFTANHWDNICRTLNISESTADTIRADIRRHLNPKPGAALGETQGKALDEITPDIILHIDYDSHISFELNNSRIPSLHIVAEDEQLIAQLANAKSKAEREALAFTRNNVERANIFIEALRQRDKTVVNTMKAIIALQRQYFLTGDDTDLQPMTLKTVADKTGYDVSTISRVCRAKYILTPWGNYRLRHFFTDSYTTDTGTTTSTRVIKNTLRDVIAAEDPRRPYSDDKLVALMAAKGYPIARRTIAKYREQLNIPVARLRKK